MGVSGLNELKDRADNYCSCPPGGHDPECILHND